MSQRRDIDSRAKRAYLSRSSTPAGKTLAAALAASHVIHGEAIPGMHIALNWLRVDDSGAFWHNGATGGYSSFVPAASL
jgi:hypothetical protein